MQDYYRPIPLIGDVKDLCVDLADWISREGARVCAAKGWSRDRYFDKLQWPSDFAEDRPVLELMRQHVIDLGLTPLRFCLFVTRGQPRCWPHIDILWNSDSYGYTTEPMTHRLNWPLLGQTKSWVQWWHIDCRDPRIDKEHYLLAKDFASWPAFDHQQQTLEPGWLRTEWAHRLVFDRDSVDRWVLTLETQEQIPWAELMSRIDQL
jgi:hypothetical protein